MDNSPEEIFGKNKEKKGLLHNHTYYSIFDGVQTPEELVKKAKELGYSSVALSDHGTLMGLARFMNACKNENINPVPGVELYFNAENIHRGHLCLYPYNNKGLRSIFRVLRASSKIREKGNKKDFPITTLEILKSQISKGDVFVTTACVNGVFAKLILPNEKELKKQAETKKELEKIIVDEKIISEYERLLKEKEELESIDTKNIPLKPLKDELKISEDKEKINKKIEDVRKENERRKEQKKEIKEKLEVLKKKIAEKKEDYKKQSKLIEKRDTLLKTLKNYTPPSASIISKRVNALFKEFFDIFGKENVFVELQYHTRKDEGLYYPQILEYAKKHKLNCVIANDAHMDTASKVQKRILAGSALFYKLYSEEPDNKEYYIKDQIQLISKISEIIPEPQVLKAAEITNALLSKVRVSIDNSLHFPKYCDNSKEKLKSLVYEKALQRYGQITPEIKNRLEYELQVITDMGYADYILIVMDYCNWARNLNEDYVGPARGSGGGSIILMLLGITEGFDPLENNLYFERFLNPERVSMPDIDVDFNPDIRNEMFKYAASKYGENHVSHIATLDFYDGKKAIRTATKLLETYNFPDNLKDEIRNLYDKFSNPFYKLGDLLSATYEDSLELLDTSKAEVYFPKQIIEKAVEFAKELQDIPSGFGVHAAGCIISDKDITDYAPVKYTESSGEEISVIECDCVQAESDFGLLKMDFLGLKTLKIISDTKNFLSEKIDLNNQGFEPEIFKEIFSKGNTAGIFQFESEGMRNTLKDFKPTTFDDIVLINALYRPGPADFIPSIIKTKEGKEKPNYFLPSLSEILDVTYGKPVYQEQIMKLLQDVGGFTLGEADVCRRAMSKKKADVFKSFKDKFIEGAIKRGANKVKVEEFWESLLSFSSYAFNKAHAVAYSLVAYRCAWLKFHYPVEFMCAVMGNTDKEEKKLQILTENPDIPIAPPDYRLMKQHFSPKNGSIMIGFQDIKGIKEFKMPNIYDFESFLKADIGEANLLKLIEVGAFDWLEISRNNLKVIVSNLKKSVADTIKKRKTLSEEKEELIFKLSQDSGLSISEVIRNDTTNIKNIAVSTFNTRKTKIKEVDKKIIEKCKLIDEYIRMGFDMYLTFKDDNRYINLEDKKKEKELLGFYASKDPVSQIPKEVLKYWSELLELQVKEDVGEEVSLLAGLVTSVQECISSSGSYYMRLVINGKLFFVFNERVKNDIKKENMLGDVFGLYLFKVLKRGDFRQVVGLVTSLQSAYREVKVSCVYEDDLAPLKREGDDSITAYISSENRFVKFLGGYVPTDHVILIK